MKKKAIVKVLLTLVILLVLLFIFKSGLYIFSSEGNLSQLQRDVLLRTAAHSLETQDVPVGAIILCNDTLLSIGYNTVIKDSDVAGHAEINAINNAIRQIGFSKFSKLDRSHLILVSTFEPCMMCMGAITEYNIRHTFFMKGKGLWHWLKNDARQLRYELSKKKCSGDFAQDSLFMLHPKYRIQNTK